METIEIHEDDVLRKRYSIRKTGDKGLSTITTLPPTVIEREARRFKMNRDDFLEKTQVVFSYNNFPGMHLSFELKEKYRDKKQPESHSQGEVRSNGTENVSVSHLDTEAEGKVPKKGK